MRAESFHTTTLESYAAGSELGEALAPCEPEAILLFVSIHYDFDDLLAGLDDALQQLDPRPVVFGVTGDGFLERSGNSDHGVAGLALHTGGRVRFYSATQTGATEAPFEAAARCAETIRAEAGDELRLALVLATHATDGPKAAAGVRSVLDVPLIGGLGGDDRRFQHSVVLCDGRAQQDAIGILGFAGELDFALNAASGWRPIGTMGTVDVCRGTTLERIGGQSAVRFIEDRLGTQASDLDLGIVSFAVEGDSRADEHFFLRALAGIDAERGEVTTFGAIDQGARVRVCLATVDQVLDGTNEAIAGLGEVPFEPAAALVMSCAGRKWILGDRAREETERILAHLGGPLPLIGLPSHGELGPFRQADGTYTPSYFHNVTMVIALLGSEAS